MSNRTVATLLDLGKKFGVPSPWDLVSQDTPARAAGSTTVVAPMALTDIPATLDPGVALDLMNSIFTFTHDWGGEPLIAHRQPDGSLRPVTEEQQKRSLANRRVIFRDGDKERRERLAEWWLRHPQRREVDQVGFWPQGTDEGRKLNLWGGLACQPIKGNCRLITSHIYNIICNRNRACWRYVLRWLGHAVRYPGVAPGTVLILLSGREGTGKSVLLEIMRRIFGAHGLLLSEPEELTRRFNDHLETVCFLGVNEAAFPGDYRQAAKFRSMITEATWLIEGKYRSARRVPNIAHIALTTNSRWAVQAGNRARRFVVLETSEERAGDRQYFEALWYQIDNGGVEAFLNLLLRVQVTSGDLLHVPRTDALRRQQLLSADSMTQWGADAASSGELVLQVGPMPQPGGGFGTRLPAKALYAPYVAWCVGMRQRPVTKTEFSRWLASLGFVAGPIKGTMHYAIPDRRTFAGAVLSKAGIIE
jgi:Family of unknown function (DUF5906)